LIAELGFDDERNTFLWLVGRDYTRHLGTFLRAKQIDPLAGLALGPRLSWLMKQTG
jgi:hypothetical protein